MEIFDFISETPLSKIFIFVGIILVVIAIIKKIGVWISLDNKSRVLLALLGVSMFIVGIYSYSKNSSDEKTLMANSDNENIVNINSEIIGSWYYTEDISHRIDIKPNDEGIEAYIGNTSGSYWVFKKIDNQLYRDEKGHELKLVDKDNLRSKQSDGKIFYYKKNK